MKHKYKRILSLALCFCMVMGFCPVEAFAAGSDTFEISFTNGTHSVTHNNDACSGTEDDIVVDIEPANFEHDGTFTVTCNACHETKSLVIPKLTPDFFEITPQSGVYDGTQQSFTVTVADGTVRASDGETYQYSDLVADIDQDHTTPDSNARNYPVRFIIGCKRDEGGDYINNGTESDPIYEQDPDALYYVPGKAYINDDTSQPFLYYTIDAAKTTVLYPGAPGADDPRYTSTFYMSAGQDISEEFYVTYEDIQGQQQKMEYLAAYKAVWNNEGSKFDVGEQISSITGPGIYFVSFRIPLYKVSNSDGTTSTGQNYYFENSAGGRSGTMRFRIVVFPSTLNPLYVNDDPSDLTYSPAGTDNWSFVLKDDEVDMTQAGTVQVKIYPADDTGVYSIAGTRDLTIEKREVLSVDALDPIDDKYVGTSAEDLGLPETVTIQTEALDGTKEFQNVAVNWDTSSYRDSAMSAQTIYGDLVLDDASNDISAEVMNNSGNPVRASITVQLLDAKEIGPVEWEDKTATYTGNPISHEIQNIPTGVVSIAYNYNGRQADGVQYNSSTPPTEVGQYTVTATFTVEAGYAQKTPESRMLYIIKLNADDSPNAPRLEEATTTTITLIDDSTTEKPVEYGIKQPDGSYKWQESNVFTGLTPDTEYTFVARYPATDTTNASDPSTESIFSTKAETYTIRFWSAFGTENSGNGTYIDQTAVLGQQVTLQANSFSRPGYSFVGWSYIKGQDTPDFTNGETVDALTVNINTIVPLFALWEVSAPTVTVTADKTTARYGDPITLTAEVSHPALADLEVSYQWYNSDGTMLPGETGQDLVLTDVADSGTYYCKVTVVDGASSASADSNRVSVTINKAAPVLDPDSMPTASDITYGQTLAESGLTNNSSIDGTLSWESPAIAPVVADSDTTNYNVIFTPDDTDNYEPAIVPITVHVDPAKLTVKANDNTITYGDAPAANGVTYSGFRFTDSTEVFHGTLGFTFSYKMGDPVPDGGTATITPNGLTADNYDIVFEDGILTVNKRQVIVTPLPDQSKQYGEEDPELKYSENGLLMGDMLDGELGREPGETVGTYAYTLGTLSSSNYQIQMANTQAVFTIAPLEVEVIWEGADAEYRYDGTDHSGDVTASFINERNAVVNLDVSFSLSGSDAPFQEVGTYLVKADYPENDGSYLLTNATITLEMLGKDSTNYVTFPSASDITYGETVGDSTLTGGNGGPNGDGSYAWADPDFTPDVGDHTFEVIFTPAPGDPTDYSKEDGYDPTDGTVHRDIPLKVIGKMAIDVDKLQISDTKVYDGTVYAAVTAGEAILVDPGDDVEITVTAYYDTPTVGAYKPLYVTFAMSGADAGRYALPERYQTTGEITQAKLTIKANDTSVEYGDPMVPNGATFTGFAEGESLIDLSGNLIFSSDYNQFDELGTYTITPSGVTSVNYDITFEDGTLTVGKREVTITPTEGQAKKVGTKDPVLKYSVLAGTVLENTPLQGELMREPGEELGTYQILQGTISNENNPYYNITFRSGPVFTISVDGPGEDPDPGPDDPETPTDPNDRDNIAAPKMESNTATSITLVTVTGAEYSIDGGKTWQDSPVFEGLTPDTAYTFVQRYKETQDLPAGKTSDSATFRTKGEADGWYEINYKDETIDFGGDYEMSRDPNFNDPAQEINPGDTIVPGETIYIRPKDDGSGSPGETKPVVIPNRPAAPDIEIDYKDETINTDEDMEYSTDGGKTWKDCDKDMDISDLTGQDILVRYPATDDTFASESTLVKIPERPDAPDLEIDFIEETLDTSRDMEYSTDGGKTWDACDRDMDISDLTGEDILVRYEADDDTFASEAEEVEIPERPDAPDIEIDFDKETINTDRDHEYSTDDGDSWDPCGKDMGVEDLMGQEILVRTAADEETFASESAEVKIPTRPGAPTLGWNDESEAGKADGSITNTSTKMEYSTDGGITWTDCTGSEIPGLSEGSYMVRYSATDNSFASYSTPIRISVGNGSGTADGDDNGNTGDNTGGNTGNDNTGDNTGGDNQGNGNGNNTGNSGSIDNNTGSSGNGGNSGTPGTGGNGNSGNNNSGNNNGNGSGVAGGNGIDKDNEDMDDPLNGNGTGGISGGNGYDDGTNEGGNTTGNGNGGSIEAGTCPSDHFVDVNQKLWYHDAVDYTFVNRFMIGINSQEWAPDTNMTKAMVCQVLYRIVGVTTSYDCTKYTDVNPGDWYYDAVAWAASVGVVTDTDTTFGSNDAVTYEELAVMIYNLCNLYGLTMVTGTTQTTATTTASSTEAQAALTAILSTGIFNVNGSTSISATGTMTRATCAQVITNFCTAFSAQISSNTNIQGPTNGIYTNPGVTNMNGVPFI